jgi:tRNA(Ile)-lysidine synthase
LFLLPAELPELELTWTEVPAAENPGDLYLLADLPDLHVRFRKGGERCKPSRRGHSQTLKKLLQEYGLELWLRDSVPLIFSGDNLVAVGDLWINEGFVAPEGTSALSPRWQIKT